MYHGLHFGLLHTSNLFPIKIISAGGLECLTLQIDANFDTKKNFFSTTFLYRVSPPYLLATTTSQEPHPKFKRYFYDYFKTKQQEFIHPLILSPTLHERKKWKSKKKKQICFPSCSSWPKAISKLTKNQSKKHTKKLRKTKQQIITLIRIKTYWDFSGFQGAIYQQLSWVCFPTKTSTGTKS